MLGWGVGVLLLVAGLVQMLLFFHCPHCGALWDTQLAAQGAGTLTAAGGFEAQKEHHHDTERKSAGTDPVRNLCRG